MRSAESRDSAYGRHVRCRAWCCFCDYRFAEMEQSARNEDGEPHYFTFEVSWEVANKGILIKSLLSVHSFCRACPWCLVHHTRLEHPIRLAVSASLFRCQVEFIVWGKMSLLYFLF